MEGQRPNQIILIDRLMWNDYLDDDRTNSCNIMMYINPLNFLNNLSSENDLHNIRKILDISCFNILTIHLALNVLSILIVVVNTIVLAHELK